MQLAAAAEARPPQTASLSRNDVTSRLGTTYRLVAELDWISGFVNRGSGLEIETVLTPISQEFEFDERGKCIRYSTTRVKKPVLRRCPLWAISSLELGNYVLRTKEHRRRRVITLTKKYEQAFRGIRRIHRSVTIADDNSSVMTFEQLLDADPNAADIIWRHAPCPKYTAFFITSNSHKSIIIPTSEFCGAVTWQARRFSKRCLTMTLLAHTHTSRPSLTATPSLIM
jgi:hypothetical protein